MKNNNLLLLSAIIIASLISGCTCWMKNQIPGSVRNGIDFCYNENPTGLDTLIPINGYYELTCQYQVRNNQSKDYDSNTTKASLIFYPDGLFYYQYQYWGNYLLKKDTIITHYFNSPCEMSWSGYEDHFLINKDKSLTLLFRTEITTNKTEKEYYEKLQRSMINNIPIARFHKLSSLPDEKKCWLLNTRWFKCKE